MSQAQAYINIKTDDRITELEKTTQILMRNVFDLQTQLQHAYIRIEELTSKMAVINDSDS
jgi:hypothetical protein